MIPSNFINSLIDKRSGTYYDISTDRYCIFLGGKKVAEYMNHYDENINKEIDNYFWGEIFNSKTKGEKR
jgi:hypothetical protein